MVDLEKLIGGDLEEAVAPNYLIVGARDYDDLSFFTFAEKKGSKVVINSEKSWRNWSQNSDDPIIIKNKFLKGFKIGEVNERFSSQAKNMEIMTLVHPEVGKRFEISLKRFVELANQCTIKNGVLDLELLMGKHNEVFTREEYKNKVLKYKESIEINKKKEKEKSELKRVPAKEQIPGKVYTDVKNGVDYLYLGTCDFICGTKKITKFVYKKTGVGSKFVKGILYNSNGSTPVMVHCSLNKSVYDSEYKVDNFNTVAVKARKQLTESSNKENMFEGLSDKDWNIIIIRAFENTKVESFETPWYKIKENCEIIPNFRRDYEEKIGEKGSNYEMRKLWQ